MCVRLSLGLILLISFSARGTPCYEAFRPEHFDRVAYYTHPIRHGLVLFEARATAVARTNTEVTYELKVVDALDGSVTRKAQFVVKSSERIETWENYHPNGNIGQLSRRDALVQVQENRLLGVHYEQSTKKFYALTNAGLYIVDSHRPGRFEKARQSLLGYTQKLYDPIEHQEFMSGKAEFDTISPFLVHLEGMYIGADGHIVVKRKGRPHEPAFIYNPVKGGRFEPRTMPRAKN